jgi:DMSO reductase family type II enzyme heme b subunit
LNAEGFSTLTRQDEQNVSGKGLRTDKGWQVVFKRKLTNADEHDVQFTGSTPMAVAIWNGGNRETNGQKGLAGWILLQFGSGTT